MEDATVKVKKKSKTGPLKSSPGFLKCMRSVYLYFKEEKEKGALNIPINSFIERTAVACGVGRKTLYNYAKKGRTKNDCAESTLLIDPDVLCILRQHDLVFDFAECTDRDVFHFNYGLFDEHPTILQPKQKKKRGKRKLKQEDIQIVRKGKKKNSSSVGNNAGTSSSHSYSVKKEPQSPSLAKNAMIQTDPRPLNPNENIVIQTSNPTNALDGFTNFIINRDQGKLQQVQIVQQNKVRETTHVLTGPWTTSTATVKRDVDYFSKNNVWHTVYNLHTTESQTCSADLNTVRMTSCPQQPTSDHLAEL